MELPDHLVNVKNGSAVNTADVIQNEKLKILIVNEPFDVVVDGSILYHSDNAVIIDKNKLQGSAEGFTVIVYKP